MLAIKPGTRSGRFQDLRFAQRRQGGFRSWPLPWHCNDSRHVYPRAPISHLNRGAFLLTFLPNPMIWFLIYLLVQTRLVNDFCRDPAETSPQPGRPSVAGWLVRCRGLLHELRISYLTSFGVDRTRCIPIFSNTLIATILLMSAFAEIHERCSFSKA